MNIVKHDLMTFILLLMFLVIHTGIFFRHKLLSWYLAIVISAVICHFFLYDCSWICDHYEKTRECHSDWGRVNIWSICRKTQQKFDFGVAQDVLWVRNQETKWAISECLTINNVILWPGYSGSLKPRNETIAEIKEYHVNQRAPQWPHS